MILAAHQRVITGETGDSPSLAASFIKDGFMDDNMNNQLVKVGQNHTFGYTELLRGGRRVNLSLLIANIGSVIINYGAHWWIVVLIIGIVNLWLHLPEVSQGVPI